MGYIGLGNAGYPMAANLPKAGFKVIVRDVDQEREKKFVKEFPDAAKIAGESEDAFKEVDVLVTMLPHGKVVREVLLGKEGVAKGLKPGGS